MSALRDEIGRLDRAKDSLSMYGRLEREVGQAEAVLKAAKQQVRRATKKRRSGVAAVRFRDWRANIERSHGAWISGDRLDFHWVAHRQSYGRFVQAAIEAEGERGRIGGATFYDTQDDMLAAKKAAGPAWKGESIWWGR